MRYYYEIDFIHIIDYHQDGIMENLKKEYADEIFSCIESLLGERISERDFVDHVKEYILCAAESVYETHHE